MKETEILEVYVQMNQGRISCICLKKNKGCECECSEDVVERDKFRDWRKTMYRDKYGRSID